MSFKEMLFENYQRALSIIAYGDISPKKLYLPQKFLAYFNEALNYKHFASKKPEKSKISKELQTSVGFLKCTKGNGMKINEQIGPVYCPFHCIQKLWSSPKSIGLTPPCAMELISPLGQTITHLHMRYY